MNRNNLRRQVAVLFLAFPLLASGSVAGANGGFTLVAATKVGGASGSQMLAVSSSGLTGAWAVGQDESGTGAAAIWRMRPTSNTWISVPPPTKQLSWAIDVSTWGPMAWIVGPGYASSAKFVYEWNGARWINRTSNSWPATFHPLCILVNGSASVWIGGQEGSQPAAAHWNGTSWAMTGTKSITGVGFSDFSSLTSVPGSHMVIAAGNRNSQGRGSGEPFAQMWNGTKWTSMSSPTLPGGIDSTVGVSASSPTNAWIVTPMATSGKVVPITLHWNGFLWKKVNAAASSSSFSGLVSVDVSSATNAWAVGDISTSPLENDPLIEHWDGISWKIVPSQPKSSQSTLNGVTAVPGSSCRVLAVGVASSSLSPNVPFGERNC